MHFDTRRAAVAQETVDAVHAIDFETLALFSSPQKAKSF
jgi:hypothetical protein